ncbi:hypothetical protein B296_00010176 [Ensete ventricosum]|uniref:Uncharacterized protein n=1 Tax=Ensete ventricosum TaxID=4639 RepID=A0A427B159_ENSVE|nr:hypothetical protein B296_00010176 [Ensete ventricosum]
MSILSSRMPLKSLNEAKRFASLTSPLIEKDWINLLKLDSTDGVSSASTGEDLLEVVLRNKFQEWLLLKVAEGCKTTGHDSQGQGVIHLSLLSAGANPSLVTDPTTESPGGWTAADLASKQGYEGLAAYLAEKGLTAHFEAMSLSGNITTQGRSISATIDNSENLSEQELCLKESLAAYRNAADAADRIQSAMRERALKLQTKAVQLVKPEMEATQIVAALKIQHAFRNFNRRKMMKAAARIQSHFRTWKTRRDYVNMRKKAIKIQVS